MRISQEHALDIIQQYCADEGIDVPKSLPCDFKEHIGKAANMTSFLSLRVGFCARVQKVLKEDAALGDAYGEFFSSVQAPVRLRMARVLGLEEYITQPMEGFTVSPRDALKSYLESLKPGQTWNVHKTEKLRSGIGRKAGILMQRLRGNLGGITRELIADVLGEDAEIVLTRNPFERENRVIKNIWDARCYFRRFLTSLKPKEEWYAEKLYAWTSQDGVHGYSVVNWTKNHCGGHFSESAIGTILGDDTYLLRNPFKTPHLIRLRGRKDAGKALAAFLRSLPEGEVFTPQRLYDWVSVDEVPGSAIRHWIRNNFGGFTEDDVRILLGDEADELLAKHPFQKQEKRITNAAIARKWLMSFLEELPKGASWSSNTLQRHGKIGGENGTYGSNLYIWIRNDYYRDDEETIAPAPRRFLMTEALVRKILGQSADATLKDHPFEIRHENVITTRGSAAKYLKKFMLALPAGESWSPTTLQFVGEIGDGIFGYSIFSWIDRNEPKRFSVQSIREVLGDEAEALLKRNPFERAQISDSLKTAEDVGRHLAIFVSALPRGKAWSPSTLFDAGRFHPESPAGYSIHRWITHNLRNDGKPDWLFVLVKLLPESSLQQHPFVHCGSGIYLGPREVKEPRAASTARRQPDISEQNLGRGIWDQSTPTPEDILIDMEERIRVKRGEAVLQLAVKQLRAAGTLTREEDTVLTRFTLEEEVKPEELDPILQKLRKKMKEIDRNTCT